MEGHGFCRGRTNLGPHSTALPTLGLIIDIICKEVINALGKMGKGVYIVRVGVGGGQGRAYREGDL